MTTIHWLKFSKAYKKLELESFTTIRRYNRTYYKPGEILRVRVPGLQNFLVKIRKVSRRRMQGIETSLLLRDTGEKTREDAIALIQSFYHKAFTRNERFSILYLDKYEEKTKIVTLGDFF